MNNEEKILQLLVQLNEKVDNHDKRFDRLEERLGRVEERLDKVEEHMEELDERSLRSAVALEGTVIPQLRLLYEGQVNSSRPWPRRSGWRCWRTRSSR